MMPLQILLLALPLPVQESASAAPAPAAVPASDPAATALLREVAATQFASEERRLVDGFQLEVFLRERGERPNDVRFNLDFNLREGERIALRIDDPERGRVDKGFDGRDYWLKEPQKERQLLNGHEFEKDREGIDEALDLCQDLLLVLDVAQLERRSRALSLDAEAEAEAPVLRGELRRADGRWLPFVLELRRTEDGVEPTQLSLGTPPAPAPAEGEAAEAAPPAEEEIPYQRFRLLAWNELDGRRIPQVVQMFDLPDPGTLPGRILEIHRFDCQTRWVPEAPREEAAASDGPR